MDISIPTPDRAENGPALFGAVPTDKLPAATPLWSAERILAFRPLDDVPRAAHSALLFVAVDGDTVAPADQTAAMHARAAGPSRLRVLHGGSHYRAFVDDIDTVFGDIRAWAAEHMA